jgi:hypothetical protein
MTEPTTETMTYEPCDQCEAPLDEQQRYCVVCGASRRHATDPLAHYLAADRRPPPAVVAPAAPSRGDGRWTAAALALLPVAAAIGVLVGRGGAGGGSDVVAALRAQKAPIVQVGGSGTAGGAATAAPATIASDFSLAKGFVIKLRTLPKAGTDAAAVTAAKRAARAKGASGVGIIDPVDFTLKPSPGGGYLLYSGEFKTRAAATRALAKLKKAFPSAAVIAVTKRAASPTSSAAVALQQHPTTKQKAAGANIVKQIQSRKGKSYVDQQRNLPDTIVVP